ncbi:Alpha/Beta hydrolase protein [Gongronella butleri]|nr:Alpha/Beta hydrolase protein [Gongronella butleri]
MLPDYSVLRWLIYGIALVQTSVAPIALLYFLYYVVSSPQYDLLSAPIAVPVWAHYWLLLELLFYVYFQITCNRMQHKTAMATLTPKERRHLVLLCIDNIEHVHEWLPGWFVDKDTQQAPHMDSICRDNVLEWIAWAFCLQRLEQVDNVKELEWMIDKFERKHHITFAPGYNDRLQARRLNLDPMNAYHRPLVFYISIQCLTVFYELVVLQWRYGMAKHHVRVPVGTNAAQDAPNVSSVVAYWHRDPLPAAATRRRDSFLATDDTHSAQGAFASYYSDDQPYPFTRSARRKQLKKPLVFIHGVGAGLMGYSPFLRSLLHQLADRPIFFVELPFVSMRCREDVPGMHEMTTAVEIMLREHGYSSAVFVGHSFGSAVTAWCCKHKPHLIDSVILIDPICFMLHYSDVCNNFVYRRPETSSEAIVKYFASTELYISHYFSRHFYWFETALFIASKSPDHKTSQYTIPMPKNTKVYLSENDNIVNSDRVYTYLHKHGINVHWMSGLYHSSFLFHPSWQQNILHTLKSFSQ